MADYLEEHRQRLGYMHDVDADDLSVVVQDLLDEVIQLKKQVEELKGLASDS